MRRSRPHRQTSLAESLTCPCQTNLVRARRHVKSMQYSVILFDTAPTGHTLRFLSFPSVLEKALAKLSGLSGKFGPMMQSMSSMMGMPANTEEMFGKLESMREVVSEVSAQFKDSDKTTFVCVCISGMFPLFSELLSRPRLNLACFYRVPVFIRDRAPDPGELKCRSVGSFAKVPTGTHFV